MQLREFDARKLGQKIPLCSQGSQSETGNVRGMDGYREYLGTIIYHEMHIRSTRNV